MRLHAQYTQTIFGLTKDSNGRNQFESDKKKKRKAVSDREEENRERDRKR